VGEEIQFEAVGLELQAKIFDLLEEFDGAVAVETLVEEEEGVEGPSCERGYLLARWWSSSGWPQCAQALRKALSSKSQFLIKAFMLLACALM
jgi:hypothetical protein